MNRNQQPTRFPVRRFADELGVTTTEYAVMVVLIALAVAAFGSGLAGSVTGVFSRLLETLALAS